VVVVEGEWGTIGEITLSYVVVYIWDERRLIVPSTYFTQTPFETWTRNSPKVYGVVMVDMDWRVPVEEVRKEFHRFIETTDLWDKRTADCLVTDATGGFLQIRFVASAEDSSKQWSLRCLIREHMVEWVRENYPDALPSTRVLVENEPGK
jgi:Mechanosensitive ion channel.